MTRFICNIASSGETSAFGCQCAICQDAWKPVTAAGPQPVPAVTTVDVPGDASTSFSVAVGTPLIGVLEVDADHDWYSVDLVAGTLYRITLDGLAIHEFEALEDPYIYLRDANGFFIRQDDDSGPRRNSLLNWTATISGQYYLDVGAWNEDYVGGY